MHRIFLLSPAFSGGERAKMLFNERAQFDLARRLRLKSVPLGEVFSFMSGLYFRGKVAYAKTFVNPPAGLPGVYVITTNRGLLEVDTPMTIPKLQAFADVEITGDDPRYHRPLRRDAKRISEIAGERCQAVLLGSIATGKYVDVLLEFFGERLVFPVDFVGRGDMSRGGLMLRCAADNIELPYVPVLGAKRHGQKPPKLAPRRYT